MIAAPSHAEVVSRLKTLHRKLVADGLYVRANTVSLALDEIERLNAVLGEAVPVPEFGSVAKRKLDSLLADGWRVNGYALIKDEQRRGFIDFSGFVGWWLPEYYQNHTSEPAPTNSSCGEG